MHTETNLMEGPTRRRGRQLALEAMGQRASRPQYRRADRRLHLVLAHRPDGLGRGPAGGEQPRHARRASTISTATSVPSGRCYKQLIQRLVRRAAGPERVPHRSCRPAAGVRGDPGPQAPGAAAQDACARKRKRTTSQWQRPRAGVGRRDGLIRFMQPVPLSRERRAPSPMLVDSHCHLDFPDFQSRLPEVLAAAAAAGVGRMVTISTHVARFETYRALAEAHRERLLHGRHPSSQRGGRSRTCRPSGSSSCRAIRAASPSARPGSTTTTTRARGTCSSGSSAPISRPRARPGCRWSSMPAMPTRT